MSTSKHFNKICCILIICALLIAVIFMSAEDLGIEASAVTFEYENRIFDTSYVHTIDIRMDNWDQFIETCTDEEYVVCDVTIDGQSYPNVAIRAKGNTSLSSVSSYGNDRYSFKIEFDHYDNGNTYYGLDKLVLNNIIQDNTYMKDYLTYQMMHEMGAAAPICSYSYITVNGEEWGLYLAIEAVEESFLQRNYGRDYGELYKPDSMNMGGGRGNGKDFEFDQDTLQGIFGEDFSMEDIPEDVQKPDMNSMPNMGEMPENFDFGNMPDMSEGFDFGDMPGMPQDSETGGTNRGEGGNRGDKGFGGFGGNDVSLIYSDDEYSSYSNIFNSAKTNITDADKNRLIESIRKLNNNEDIESVVNIDEVIRYFAVHNFVLNFDSYTGSMIHNYYLYEEDGMMSMIPWDYNLAYGGFMASTDATSLINYPVDSPVSGGTTESRPMLSWIFESEEYTALYHEYLEEFISDYFESGAFEVMFTETVQMIAPYVEKDPTSFCTYEEFEVGVQTLKEFCMLRAESVRGQLDGKIPATDEGQSAEGAEETFVDASGLDISSMGSMGFGGGFGGFGDRGEGPARDETQQGGTPDSNVTDGAVSGGAITDGTIPDMGDMPQMPENFGGQMPDMSQPPDMGDMPQMPGGAGGFEGFDGQMPEGFEGFEGFGGQMPGGFNPFGN